MNEQQRWQNDVYALGQTWLSDGWLTLWVEPDTLGGADIFLCRMSEIQQTEWADRVP